MKNLITSCLCVLFWSPLCYGQTFKIRSDGKISMNALDGKRLTAPQIRISSSSTSSDYSALDLFNADMMLKNAVGIDFSGYNNHQGESLFASMKAIFTNRTSLSASMSMVSSELHFLTMNMGQFASRFSIKPGAHFNNIRYDFNTQVGNALVLEANVTGSLLYSMKGGSLGIDSLPWGTLYVHQPYFSSSPVISSDTRRKNTIQAIGKSSLNQLRKLQAVSYKSNTQSHSLSSSEVHSY